MTETLGPSPATAANRLSLLQIMAESLRLYRVHWRPMTLALLPSMARILGGLYACLILSYLFINVMTTEYRPFTEQNTLPVLGVNLLICLATLTLFCRGCWDYLICMVSFNLDARDALDHSQNRKPGNIPDDKPDAQRAMDCRKTFREILQKKERPYMTVLLGGMALGTVAALPALLLGPLVSLGKALMPAGPATELLALLAFFILLLPLIVATILLSFTFQITAFEPIPLNPAPTLLASARVAWRRFPATTGLQVILFLITGTLVPVPVVFLLRQLHLSLPVDGLHQWMIGLILEGASPETGGWSGVPPAVHALYTQIYGEMQRHVVDFSASLTDSALASLIMSLLLPLGSFAFTLLYLDIRKPDRP